MRTYCCLSKKAVSEKEIMRIHLHIFALSVSGSRARGLGFDTRSGHLLLFLLSLIKERQLSATGESICI